VKGAKLYVSDDGKNFTELQGLLHSPNVKPVKRIPLDEAFTHYDEKCITHKCLKNQNNERLYFYKLRNFLKSQGVNAIDEVTRVLIEEFESDLAKIMNPNSVNRRMCGIKHFFSKCLEWGFVLDNPAAGMKKRKVERNPFKPWPFEIIFSVLLMCDGIYSDLFYFLYLTGARPMEAKNLKWSDIDYENKWITLKCGKNAEVSRRFPLTPELDSLLHQIKPVSQFVFSDEGKQINNDLLYHYIKDRLSLFTDKKLTVYGLRHTFGSDLTARGTNAFTIANLMGHRNLRTTMSYQHFEQDNLIKVLE
jgi:integrase